MGLSRGCPINVVSTGHSFDTSCDSGFSVSTSYPVSTASSSSSSDTTKFVESIIEDTTFLNDSCDSSTVLIENNPVLLAQHMKQYGLASAWDTDKTNLSLSDNLLARAKR